MLTAFHLLRLLRASVLLNSSTLGSVCAGIKQSMAACLYCMQVLASPAHCSTISPFGPEWLLVVQPVLDKRTNMVQAVLVAADKCETDTAASLFQATTFTPSDR